MSSEPPIPSQTFNAPQPLNAVIESDLIEENDDFKIMQGEIVVTNDPSILKNKKTGKLL